MKSFQGKNQRKTLARKVAILMKNQKDKVKHNQAKKAP